MRKGLDKLITLLDIPFRVNRGTYIACAGIALIFISALGMRWINIPAASASQILADQTLVAWSPWSAVEILYKALTLAGAIFVVIQFRLHGWTRCRARVLGWSLALLILSYPAALSQLDSERIQQARSQNEEMERVTGDMEFNFSHQQSDWRKNHYFAEEAKVIFFARENKAIGKGLNLLAPGEWDRPLTHGFGYSRHFLAFISFGPVVALAGWIAMLLGCYLILPSGGEIALADMRRATPILLLILVCILTPKIVGDQLYQKGNEAVARGERQVAIRYWKNSEFWIPELKYALAHVSRIGEAQRHIGQMLTPEGALHDTHSAVLKHDLELALRHLREAEVLGASGFGYDHFLAAVLSEAGRWAFDEDQISLADEYWCQSLKLVPINPMAWYGRSLCQIKEENFAAAEQSLWNIATIQSFHRFQRLTVKAQGSVLSAWRAFWAGDIVAAHEHYSTSLKPESW